MQYAIARLILVAYLALLLSACGGGGGSGSSSGGGTQEPKFSIGGNLSGLTGTVVLQNNAGNNLSLATNGAFAFGTSVSNGAAYSVTVLTQPAGQNCTVSNGAGNAAANVTNVTVNCIATTFTVGGALSGLASGTLVLQNNGGNDLSLTSSGNFTFTTGLASGAAYNVTVLTQPAGHTCTVANGAGNLAANIANVAVTCQSAYSIGGTVSGLTGTLALQNNLGDNLSVTTAAFTFPIAVASNGAYFVSILNQPSGQTCQLANWSGTATANVTNVAATCTNNAASFAIGGNVSGLGAGKTLVLQNNGGDNRTITANGPYAFTTQLAVGAPYLVAVLTQPVGQTCMLVANALGMVQPATGLNNVTVFCHDGTTVHTVGGTIVGLTGTGLKLFMTVNNAALSVPANATTFTFPNGLVPGTEFRVGVTAQPSGQTCVVTNFSGVDVTDVTNVKVTCIDNTTDSLGGIFKVPTPAGTDAYIALFPDGTYSFATRENDASCGGGKNGNGVELGVYSYSQTTGAFAIKSAVLDNNGACGVWDNGTDSVGTLQKAGIGQAETLTFTPSIGGGTPVTLTAVPSTAASTTGAYVAPFGKEFIIFGGDGHYFLAQMTDDIDAGIEYGCYTQSGTASGDITPNLSSTSCAGAVDTNNDAGLSDSSGLPIPYMTLGPYAMLLGSGADRIVLIRIVPN